MFNFFRDFPLRQEKILFELLNFLQDCLGVQSGDQKAVDGGPRVERLTRVFIFVVSVRIHKETKHPAHFELGLVWLLDASYLLQGMKSQILKRLVYLSPVLNNGYWGLDPFLRSRGLCSNRLHDFLDSL